MSQLLSSPAKLLKCELTLKHIVITLRLEGDDVNIQQLEIPLSNAQLVYRLCNIIEHGTGEQQLALFSALEQWSSILEILTREYAQFQREDCVRITKAVLTWVESEDFRSRWQQLIENKEYESQAYTLLRDNLAQLRAKYSEEPSDIWPFIQQITGESSQERTSLSKQNTDSEEAVWSVMCRNKKQQTIKDRLFEDDQFYNEVTIWFRLRLNFARASTLIRAQQKYQRKMRLESNRLISRSHRVKGQPREVRFIVQALHIDPNNRRARKLASKLGITQKEKKEKGRIGDTFRAIGWSLVTIAGFILVVLIYAVPRLITILKTAQISGADLHAMLFHSPAIPQLGILVIYGIVLAYLLFKSLTRALMPEPLRTLLALTFFNSAIPLADNSLWVKAINLSDSQLGGGIALGIIFTAIFTFRDVFRKVRPKVGSEQAWKRTLIALGLVIGQELLYTILLSDLIGRSLLTGPHPQIDEQPLINYYTWGIVPKLIIVPISSYFSIYLFPPVMLLLCFLTIAVGTVQEGTYTILEGIGMRG